MILRRALPCLASPGTAIFRACLPAPLHLRWASQTASHLRALAPLPAGPSPPASAPERISQALDTLRARASAQGMLPATLGHLQALQGWGAALAQDEGWVGGCQAVVAGRQAQVLPQHASALPELLRDLLLGLLAMQQDGLPLAQVAGTAAAALAAADQLQQLGQAPLAGYTLRSAGETLLCHSLLEGSSPLAQHPWLAALPAAVLPSLLPRAGRAWLQDLQALDSTLQALGRAQRTQRTPPLPQPLLDALCRALEALCTAELRRAARQRQQAPLPPLVALAEPLPQPAPQPPTDPATALANSSVSALLEEEGLLPPSSSPLAHSAADVAAPPSSPAPSAAPAAVDTGILPGLKLLRTAADFFPTHPAATAHHTQALTALLTAYASRLTPSAHPANLSAAAACATRLLLSAHPGTPTTPASSHPALQALLPTLTAALQAQAQGCSPPPLPWRASSLVETAQLAARLRRAAPLPLTTALGASARALLLLHHGGSSTSPHPWHTFTPASSAALLGALWGAHTACPVLAEALLQHLSGGGELALPAAPPAAAVLARPALAALPQLGALLAGALQHGARLPVALVQALLAQVQPEELVRVAAAGEQGAQGKAQGAQQQPLLPASPVTVLWACAVSGHLRTPGFLPWAEAVEAQLWQLWARGAQPAAEGSKGSGSSTQRSLLLYRLKMYLALRAREAAASQPPVPVPPTLAALLASSTLAAEAKGASSGEPLPETRWAGSAASGGGGSGGGGTAAADAFTRLSPSDIAAVPLAPPLLECLQRNLGVAAQRLAQQAQTEQQGWQVERVSVLCASGGPRFWGGRPSVVFHGLSSGGGGGLAGKKEWALAVAFLPPCALVGGSRRAGEGGEGGSARLTAEAAAQMSLIRDGLRGQGSGGLCALAKVPFSACGSDKGLGRLLWDMLNQHHCRVGRRGGAREG